VFTFSFSPWCVFVQAGFAGATALLFTPNFLIYVYLILKSYNRNSEIQNPHFFILNKGNNSGKPLVSPCPNCFVIQFQYEEEKEQVFWLLYSL